jgi:hypothetical protein
VRNVTIGAAKFKMPVITRIGLMNTPKPEAM